MAGVKSYHSTMFLENINREANRHGTKWALWSMLIYLQCRFNLDKLSAEKSKTKHLAFKFRLEAKMIIWRVPGHW